MNSTLFYMPMDLNTGDPRADSDINATPSFNLRVQRQRRGQKIDCIVKHSIGRGKRSKAREVTPIPARNVLSSRS